MISMLTSPSLQRAAAGHRGGSSTRRCNLPTASLPERSTKESTGCRRTALLRFCVAHDMQSSATTSVVGSTTSASEGMLLSKRTLLAMSAVLMGLSDPGSAHAGSAEWRRFPNAIPDESAPATSPAVSETASAPSLSAVSQETQQFRSDKQRYLFSVPSVWEKVNKDGADVLFEDPAQRSTSLGVTVNRVRVSSIADFGTLEAVGEKLLTAEQNKDSTLGTVLVSSSSRVNESGATIYDYEYELENTRGRRRILNTVTIFDSKLFILNAAAKCSKEPGGCTALESGERVLETLRAAARSFDVIAGPA